MKLTHQCNGTKEHPCPMGHTWAVESYEATQEEAQAFVDKRIENNERKGVDMAFVGNDKDKFVSEPCYKCGKPTMGVYVRDKKDGVWDSCPVCDECYDMMYPGRQPYRICKEV